MNMLNMEIIQKELENLQRQHPSNLLLAVSVVEAARETTSVLHPYFEWDDSKAAARYRLAQARQLIRTIFVHEERTGEPVRSFLSLPSDRCAPGGGYRHLTVVLSVDSLKQEKLGELQRSIDRMLESYESLLKLEPQFIAIRAAVPRFSADLKQTASAKP